MKYSQTTRIIVNKDIRTLIDRFVASTFGRRKCDNKKEYTKLSDKDMETVKMFLHKPENKVLNDFINYCTEVFKKVKGKYNDVIDRIACPDQPKEIKKKKETERKEDMPELDESNMDLDEESEGKSEHKEQQEPTDEEKKADEANLDLDDSDGESDIKDQQEQPDPFKMSRKKMWYKGLYHILRHITGNVSVLQFAHPQLMDKLIQFDNITWNYETEKLFHEFCAVLHLVIAEMVHIYGGFSNIPTAFREMMKFVGKRGKEVETDIINIRYKAGNPLIHDAEATEKDKEEMADSQKSGTILSGPLLYNRLNYSIDKQEEKNDSKCSKNYVKMLKMTSSLMIARCTHRLGIAAHVCKDGESVDDVISFCTSTMKKAPRHIVYDNACKLADSARLREYKYFDKTVFSGDEQHSPCHKCGYLFNVFYWKHGWSFMRNTNDSACEQGNNILLSMRLAAKFMSLDTMMRMLRVAMELDNRRLYIEKYKDRREKSN